MKGLLLLVFLATLTTYTVAYSLDYEYIGDLPDIIENYMIQTHGDHVNKIVNSPIVGGWFGNLFKYAIWNLVMPWCFFTGQWKLYWTNDVGEKFFKCYLHMITGGLAVPAVVVAE
jgi:hypothetical protein